MDRVGDRGGRGELPHVTAMGGALLENLVGQNAIVIDLQWEEDCYMNVTEPWNSPSLHKSLGEIALLGPKIRKVVTLVGIVGGPKGPCGWAQGRVVWNEYQSLGLI